MFNHVLMLDMILKARAGGRVEIFTFFFLHFSCSTGLLKILSEP